MTVKGDVCLKVAVEKGEKMSVYRNEEGRWILSTNNPDVVEVVRCKDCIHNHVSTWNHGVRDKPMCHFTDLVRSNEFYCGFGERKDDAKEE